MFPHAHRGPTKSKKKTKPAVAVLSIVWLVLVNIILYVINENSFIAKFFGFHGALAVSNRADYVANDQRPQEYFGWDILNPESLVSGIANPIAILVYRIVVLLFFIGSLVFQAKWGSGFSANWINFLSHWNFMLMAVYSVLGIGVSAKGLTTTLVTWGFLEKFFLGTFVCACTTGIFLTVFFWTVVIRDVESRDEDILYHGINVLLMLGEVVVSEIPLCSYHFQMAMIYLSAYSIFVIGYFLATGEWIYEALSWEEYMHLIYYFLIPVLMAASFFLTYFIAWLREWFTIQEGSKTEPLFFVT